MPDKPDDNLIELDEFRKPPLALQAGDGPVHSMYFSGSDAPLTAGDLKPGAFYSVEFPQSINTAPPPATGNVKPYLLGVWYLLSGLCSFLIAAFALAFTATAVAITQDLNAALVGVAAAAVYFVLSWRQYCKLFFGKRK